MNVEFLPNLIRNAIFLLRKFNVEGCIWNLYCKIFKKINVKYFLKKNCLWDFTPFQRLYFILDNLDLWLLIQFFSLSNKALLSALGLKKFSYFVVLWENKGFQNFQVKNSLTTSWVSCLFFFVFFSSKIFHLRLHFPDIFRVRIFRERFFTKLRPKSSFKTVFLFTSYYLSAD